MEHPLDAIAWLARALVARGLELDAGDLITTGTCLGLLQVLPGQTFEADFGELGRVDVTLE
jgi:2-keto-4-pentenoate hydratase